MEDFVSRLMSNFMIIHSRNHRMKNIDPELFEDLKSIDKKELCKYIEDSNYFSYVFGDLEDFKDSFTSCDILVDDEITYYMMDKFRELYNDEELLILYKYIQSGGGELYSKCDSINLHIKFLDMISDETFFLNEKIFDDILRYLSGRYFSVHRFMPDSELWIYLFERFKTHRQMLIDNMFYMFKIWSHMYKKNKEIHTYVKDNYQAIYEDLIKLIDWYIEKGMMKCKSSKNLTILDVFEKYKYLNDNPYLYIKNMNQKK